VRTATTILLAASVTSIVPTSCATPQAERSAAVASSNPAAWPPLPTTGFVAGRAATKLDVQEGNAMFVAEHENKVVGVPLAIEIPQYALHVDAESGVRTRVVLIQAERAGGVDMVGYRNLATGGDGVGTLPEFQLLGRTAPAQ